MIAAPTPMAYKGTLDCVATILREDGFVGLFDGALTYIVRAVVGAAVFELYFYLVQAWGWSYRLCSVANHQ